MSENPVIAEFAGHVRGYPGCQGAQVSCRQNPNGIPEVTVDLGAPDHRARVALSELERAHAQGRLRFRAALLVSGLQRRPLEEVDPGLAEGVEELNYQRAEKLAKAGVEARPRVAQPVPEPEPEVIEVAEAAAVNDPPEPKRGRK